MDHAGKAVDVEKWEESEESVALAVRTSLWAQIACLTSAEHENIGDNVAVGEHDTLWMAGSSTGVDEERNILVWPGLGSQVPGRSGNVLDAGEVLVVWCSLVTEDNDAIIWNTSDLSRCQSVLQECGLGNECLCSRVLELESKLLWSISWIGWRNNAACPECSPNDSWEIDAVRCVRCENIASLPIPQSLEALSKLDGSLLNLLESVVAARLWVDVDNYYVT